MEIKRAKQEKTKKQNKTKRNWITDEIFGASWLVNELKSKNQPAAIPN